MVAAVKGLGDDSPDRKGQTLDKLLSPMDLAKYLGVPRSTVYEWRYKGTGPPASRIGKHVRYRASDIERWLVERQGLVKAAGG